VKYFIAQNKRHLEFCLGSLDALILSFTRIESVNASKPSTELGRLRTATFKEIDSMLALLSRIVASKLTDDEDRKMVQAFSRKHPLCLKRLQTMREEWQ